MCTCKLYGSDIYDPPPPPTIIKISLLGFQLSFYSLFFYFIFTFTLYYLLTHLKNEFVLKLIVSEIVNLKECFDYYILLEAEYSW